MELKLRLTRKSVALLVVVAAAISVGVAYAAIPDSNTKVFAACMLKGVGTIRLIDTTLPAANVMSHCTSLEAPVSWNQQGQAGRDGLNGTNGMNGSDGRDGKDGNLALAGQSCPTRSAVTGFDSAGNIVCGVVVVACELLLTGAIQAVGTAGMQVGSTNVRVDSSTIFTGAGAPASLSDLQPGNNVQVCASVEADGSILASSVTRFA